MNDQEWATRNALNAYLEGLHRNAFAEYAREFAARYGWGPWSTDDSQKQELQNQLEGVYDSVAQNPAPYLQHFGVRYVLLPAYQEPPAYLAKGWRRIAGGPSVQIWERSPTVPENRQNSPGNA
jgi:hypothetical protein